MSFVKPRGCGVSFVDVTLNTKIVQLKYAVKQLTNPRALTVLFGTWLYLNISHERRICKTYTCQYSYKKIFKR